MTRYGVDVEREKKLQVPLHHLGSVVCFGNIMLLPALMTASAWCCARGGEDLGSDSIEN